MALGQWHTHAFPQRARTKNELDRLHVIPEPLAHERVHRLDPARRREDLLQLRAIGEADADRGLREQLC